MNLKTPALLLALLSSSEAFGAVIVTPASPNATDTITIRVENTFGAEARASSASITQPGNTFVIQQNVDIACSLPSNPVVVSEFQIGPLATGAYTVTANITFTGSGPLPCSPPPITQTAIFTVTSAAAIPAVDGYGLFFLATALAVSATATLSRLPK
jgi:hypothetical protein